MTDSARPTTEREPYVFLRRQQRFAKEKFKEKERFAIFNWPLRCAWLSNMAETRRPKIDEPKQLRLLLPGRYLTVDEVAELLGVPTSFIYRRTCRGHSDPLPSYRFGGHLRFRPDDIQAWIEKHRQEPAPPPPMPLVAATRPRRPRARGTVSSKRAKRG